MRIAVRIVASCCLLAGVVSAFAQGGAAGGFGGGGAGFQGGTFAGDTVEVQKTLFLSPGDRTEWEFEAQEHEALLVKVTSSVFDPAVSIQDEAGKKLADNDDIEPGNQMAQLVYALPKAGKYKVLVTNYKGTAGGAFEFYAQRFFALDAKLGERTVLALADKHPWAKVDITKPGDYVATLRTGSAYPSFRILKGNGETLDEVDRVDQSYGRTRNRFTISEPGTYFVRFASVEKPDFRIAPVKKLQANLGAVETGKLEEDDVQEWTVAAKAGDVVEVRLPGNPDTVQVAVASDDRDPVSGKTIYSLVRNDYLNSTFDLAVLRDATIAYTVINTRAVAADYRVSAISVAKPFPDSAVLRSKLDWNQAEFWTFPARVGEVVRFVGSSPTYALTLSALQADGTTSDGRPARHDPRYELAMQVRTPGQCILQVVGGGVGAYEIQRQTIAPKALPLGTAESVLARDTPEVWRISMKRGQDLALRVGSADLHWSLQLIDPSGTQIMTATTHTGKDSDFLRWVADRDGDFTLVVSSADDTFGKYRLRLIDLDR